MRFSFVLILLFLSSSATTILFIWGIGSLLLPYRKIFWRIFSRFSAQELILMSLLSA